LTDSVRRALLALGLLLPAPSLGTAAALVWWPGTALGTGLFVLTKVWTVLLPAVWVALVDRRPLARPRLPRRGLGAGAASGLLIAGVVWAAYLVASRLGVLDGSLVAARAAETGLASPSVYLFGALYWITVNSLLEEYVWRWFVFRRFEAILGARAAVVAAALAFTIHHVVALAAQVPLPLTALASAGVFTGGVTWSWLYRRYASIWPGYVSHALVDVAVFVIGYRLIFG
jgi:membrane protease YdiL (CAAX protease family)